MTLEKKYLERYILIFLILLCAHKSRSQDFFATLFAGQSNYTGDLQDKFFSFSQAHPAGGVGLVFELNEKMLIRADFTYGRISAHDKYGKNFVRNLSFYTNITEYFIGFEYNLVDLYMYKVSPYFFTGVALYDFNPYTKDDAGNPIYLAELSTEGQGFYNGRQDYKLRQLSIPMGVGIMWAINDNKRIGISVGFRKTFTDYIDDVSTTYVDEDILEQNRGQKVVDIAYRGDEIPNGILAYPTGGTPRGSPKGNDWYYFTGLTFRIRILPKGRAREIKFDLKKARRSQTKCPAVY